MKKNLVIKSLFLLTIIQLISCGGAIGDFKLMRKLQDTLSHIYKTDNIEVKTTNGEFLQVSFINTPYNDSTDDQKIRVSINVGKIVHYVYKNSQTKLKDGTVIFVNKSNYGIVNTSNYVAFDMYLDSLQNNKLEEIKKDSINK
jgi:hypothetical protein